MTFDYQVLLIAVVFASQIAVLSFYAPMSWRRYHALLFRRYPREEYPLLHPLPREELERKFELFRFMHLIIGVGAALTFVWALVFAEHLRGFAGLMQMCLLAQLLPLYIALPLSIRIQKALQSMPPPSRRSVELRKWRATDFISPMWIGLGLTMQALNFACMMGVYLYRLDTLGSLIGLFFSGGTLLLMCFALSPFAYRMATRADPYMSQPDTFRVRQGIYRGLFVVGAVFGAWSTFTLINNAGLIHFDVSNNFLGSSILFQLVGLGLVYSLNRDLSTRDFSVYRPDGSAQVAP
jgi:hypothetical protein